MTFKHLVLPGTLATLICAAPMALSAKFSCDILAQVMGQVSAPETLRFCNDALTSCETMKMLAKFEATPWVKAAKAELETRHIQNMAACELAVMNYNPDYYQENLSQ
ncbi:MAG: hypothetical protein C0514_04220 [Candidatus Puniceispirillum sp.]|nr:hypothetical protein [Candidatus Puniceispirillum sp.]